MDTHTEPSTSWLRIAALGAVLGGAGAVGAEVVFTRHLALLFGITASAAAAVVAVYMAGMAVGAVLGGRVADRLGQRALRLYVGAELLAAVWAVFFPWMLDGLTPVVTSIPSDWHLLGCVFMTVLLVGPAAVGSGATFPALTRVVGDGRHIRRLYAFNAAGAALGGLLAGLWLPSSIGLQATLWLSAGLSLVAGVLVWCLGRRHTIVETVHLEDTVDSSLTGREALAAYSVIGGLGMGAEIGWTRLLEQSGPNPGSLCFPIVLSTYLLGLVIGGLLSGRSKRPRRTLGWCALMAGGITVLVMAILPILPEERLLGHLVGEGPGNVAIFRATGVQVSADRLAVYLSAVLIPGIAAGIAFPLTAAAMARQDHQLGRGVGTTSASGIAAAVVVSLWMGLLPSWGPGSVHLTAMLGGVALLTGAMLLRSWPAAVLGLASGLSLLLPPWAGLQIPPGESVQAFVETAAGPSAVTEGADMPHVYTHGERVGGLQLDLEFPMVLHPSPENVLVIAFGTGMNIRGFARDPAVTSLTCVDIDAALPALGAHIPQTGADLFDGERVQFVHADGRHFLQQSTDRRWDVIYSDVATYAQYVELGTVEFFTLARQRLAPGGMFTVKLHPDTLTPEGLARFLATFLEVFPEAAMFARMNPVPVLVGFTAPPPGLDVIAARGIAAGGLYGVQPQVGVPRHVQLGPTALARIAAGPLATDNRPLSLRETLVGPLTVDAVDGAALPALVRAAEEGGARASADVFGFSAQRIPWRPRSVPLRSRRGWFVEEDPRAPLMLPPGPRR